MGQGADYELIKSLIKASSEGDMKGIIGYTENDIVSSDVCGETYRSVRWCPFRLVVEISQ